MVNLLMTLKLRDEGGALVVLIDIIDPPHLIKLR